MPNEPTADDFRRLLKRRGMKLNTLHAALRVPYLDERKRHYFRERVERIIKFISMIGGIRAPDLRRIVGLTQPTLWRLVERLRLAGVLRVEHSYHDHIAGARARWIQPAGSADLTDDRRADLIETAHLIRDYLRLWELEEAHARRSVQEWP